MPDLTLVPPLLLLVAGVTLGFLIAYAYALIWKARYARGIRQDAVQRSQATIAGLVHEQIVPFLPGFPFNPKDARFIGSPVDFIVFDGLDVGRLERIVLLEVKTGNAKLTSRERQIRDVARAGMVSWHELRVGHS